MWQETEQGHCAIAEIEPIADVRAKPDEHSLTAHLPYFFPRE
jgi:hypothetical protein